MKGDQDSGGLPPLKLRPTAENLPSQILESGENSARDKSDLEKGVDNEAYEPEIMEKMKDNFLHDNDGNDGEALQPLEPGYTRPDGEEEDLTSIVILPSDGDGDGKKADKKVVFEEWMNTYLQPQDKGDLRNQKGLAVALIEDFKKRHDLENQYEFHDVQNPEKTSEKTEPDEEKTCSRPCSRYGKYGLPLPPPGVYIEPPRNRGKRERFRYLSDVYEANGKDTEKDQPKKLCSTVCKLSVLLILFIVTLFTIFNFKHFLKLMKTEEEKVEDIIFE